MIGIISCTKDKLQVRNVKAKVLYSKSTLFTASYRVMKKLYPEIPVFILSAKYGLISEDEIISYYDESFNDMKKSELPRINVEGDFVFIGGDIYKQVLNKRPTIEIGEGLPIGKKVSYLKSLL